MEDKSPGYYDVIKNRIDLGTIKKRLASGRFYVSKQIFKADINRRFKTASNTMGDIIQLQRTPLR